LRYLYTGGITTGDILGIEPFVHVLDFELFSANIFTLLRNRDIILGIRVISPKEDFTGSSLPLTDLIFVN
jgi:hypothetical protein